MKLPDGTVLMHGSAPYDPVKAHQYYMRVRQLKGRAKGSADMLGGPTRRSSGGTVMVKMPSGKTVALTQQQLSQQKAVAAKRVDNIKKNLAKLTFELRVRMREAQSKAAPPTAADKSKAAREAKQYRAKNQQQISNKANAAAAKAPVKPKLDPVAQLQEQISQIKTQLSVAVAHQRSLLAATTPAKRGR